MKATAKKLQPRPQARGLGKGLSALMSESYSQVLSSAGDAGSVPERAGGAMTLKLGLIHPGRYQPRGRFADQAMAELAESVREHGIMQPILVRPREGGEYEIVAGERRYRAAKLAGLSEIPVLVRTIEDEHALELALVENVQREDLNPLEEAAGYQRLMDEFGHTQEDLASATHKSRSHIANLLRLLLLPEDLRDLLAAGKISMGHARALMGAEDASALAAEVVRRGLSVRQIEERVRGRKGRGPGRKPRVFPRGTPSATEGESRARDKDPDILALEETLSENLGLKVSIEDRGSAGAITIAYESLEQLDEILRRLGGSI